MIAQAIKRYARRRVVGVLRRIVRGTEAEVGARLRSTQGATTAVINTAYSRAASGHLPLPACPAGAQDPCGGSLKSDSGGRDVVDRDGLQFLLRASLFKVGGERRRSETPMGRENPGSQAAELTDHCWSLYELLSFAVPPAALKRRGRRPRWLLEASAHAA